MKTLLLATAFAAAFVLPAASCPAPAVCVVADPTGTPLNVRSAPNGTILGALHNDTPVQITGFTMAGNKTWARIVPVGNAKRGWVFFDFLSCDGQ